MEYVHIQDEKIPALGLGTWQMKGETCEKAVKNALDIGYRHVDTAQAYDNEEHVGNAISESGVNREEIWLTTKIWRSNFSHQDVIESVNQSLNKLQTHYVDLLLIHWPSEKVPLKETLEAMEELVAEEKVRNIGISNFTPSQMDDAQRYSDLPILTNQVEYHPFLDQSDVLEKCRDLGMMLTAYSPLARGEVMKNETLEEIGDKYGKTSAQVALRWLVQQHNVSAIPKAASREHQKDNFEVFDFELDKRDMQTINELKEDSNRRKVDPGFAPWN